MKLTPILAGFSLVAVGGFVAWFHLGKLLKEKTGTYIWYYIPLTLLGGLAISIGSNLIASGINTKLIRN
jgi:hypothetical protein|tara:strand:- start:3119 stop:3325 length:207 start_codon:yes stop_codon:yes gene_type:complete